MLTRIQNTSNQSKGTHIESLTIQNSKPMSPLELESLMEMAAG
ncbi:hypothetical protein [Pseudomonas solani]